MILMAMLGTTIDEKTNGMHSLCDVEFVNPDDGGVPVVDIFWNKWIEYRMMFDDDEEWMNPYELINDRSSVENDGSCYKCVEVVLCCLVCMITLFFSSPFCPQIPFFFFFFFTNYSASTNLVEY